MSVAAAAALCFAASTTTAFLAATFCDQYRFLAFLFYRFNNPLLPLLLLLDHYDHLRHGHHHRLYHHRRRPRLPLPPENGLLLHGQRAGGAVHLVVEAAAVAHRLALVRPAPQRGGAGGAVAADEVGARAGPSPVAAVAAAVAAWRNRSWRR